MSSLERLIELAKRTGDRLIVHDPLEGNDVVIMDVDYYESLVLGFDNTDVRELSEAQLLNQINRDIAVWRTNKEMNNDFIDENELTEVDGESEECVGDFGWHSTEQLLKDKYKKVAEPEFVPEKKTEPVYQPLPAQSKEEEIISNFPKSDKLTGEEGMTVNNNGALLPDEPVFYEEPV